MMPSDAERKNLAERRLIMVDRLPGAGGRVIHATTTFEPLLKLGRVFAKIVQQPGCATDLGATDRIEERRGTCGRVSQVLCQSVPLFPIN